MTTPPKGKLNRQELGWLLTQEAQGAAERLRKGVQVLMTNPPPPGESEPGVVDTLDALDDAMKMLSSLHNRPIGIRGRRGRIDLAALLWELAPEARVSLEPGSGTEVFGDESELRRMMNVLVGPGSRGGSNIRLRREGDEVQLAVTLGPDSSAASDAERAWLSRMAIRYGGRYELVGGQEILALPAEGAADRDEKEALRKELDEARRQGEAYARELAAMIGDEAMTPSSFPPAAPISSDRFASLVRAAGGIAAELRGMLSPVGWDLLSLRALDPSALASGGESASERLEAIQRRLMQVQDFIGELAGFGELDQNELAQEVDLIDAARLAVRHASSKAERAGVDLRLVTVPDGPEARAPARCAPRALAVMMRALVSHAVTATPRGKGVVLTVSAGSEAGHTPPRLTVDDGGGSLPASARRPFLALEVEPGTYGRPSALALHFGQAIASFQSASFALEDSPQGGLRVALSFGR